MPTRLATMCLAAMILLGASLYSTEGQRGYDARSVKGISGVAVVVGDLLSGAKALELTEEVIRSDVEQMLRSKGLNVVPIAEYTRLPGSPYLYVNLAVTDDGRAASIQVSLNQNVRLERNNELILGVGTWTTGKTVSNPTAQALRSDLKDIVDRFLKAWL